MERWKAWNLEKDIPKSIILKSLTDDENGLKLQLYQLENDDAEITIVFSESVLGYRNTDEGKFIRTIDEVCKLYGKDFFVNHSTFEVENSKYLQWFHEETYNMYEDYTVKHYIIKTQDDIVEVLTTYEPEVNLKI